ncbi:MAG: glycosyltransferase family 2 protein [Caulobacteraceae bacterium]
MTRAARDETWIDAFLSLAPRLPAPTRRWMARWAAARSLAGPALRAAPRDPLVLTRLGLHGQAVATAGGGRRGVIARAAAAASLGDLDQARRWRERAQGLSTSERRLLASAAAPFDPRLALSLLPSREGAARAACALAAHDLELARDMLAGAADSQQSRFLTGALAAWRGDWRAARRALNRAFAADGLWEPLDGDAETPTTLDSFVRSRPAGTAEGPLISVVMAARDAAATLALAVSSLLAQTWRNLEVIIVDDHSADATASLARRLVQEDGRVRVLANLRTPGAYGARNTGLAAARGAFIALHDADDWAHPQRLQLQMASLGRDKGLTLCRHMRVDLGGRPLCPRVFPFVRLSPITTTARAETWKVLGPFDEVPVGADSEWLARFDARFGRRAAPRTREVGLVALWAPHSLSGSAASGLLGEGLRARVDYVETWRRRHARGQ